MKESLREISFAKGGGSFSIRFTFQYGPSIDCGSGPYCASPSNVFQSSLAITLADEQRWDGQERSTPISGLSARAAISCRRSRTMNRTRSIGKQSIFLFVEYEALFGTDVFQHLMSRTPRPDDMKQDAYERTLRAPLRSTSPRYLLPLATNTSLGEIVNARTLETQVFAFTFTHATAEVRRLGETAEEGGPGAGLQRESRLSA